MIAGRYRIDRELGRGGMATVYLARDEELNRPVALKMLAEALTGDEAFRARFVREAQLAGRLAHPNVVQVYDAGEDNGRPFIVMEYVPGKTLAECGRLDAARVVDLGTQACAGLQHAHDAGVVHRDVKPGNLLLRDDGSLKIVDFGIARAAEATRHTQVGTLLGTAAYLAPEQIAGGDATVASDIYSLGAVLYELLTGRTPYVFDSLAELAAQQTAGVITPVCDVAPSVPAHVEAAAMHALARDPQFRPGSAAELAAELRGSVGEEALVPSPPPRRSRLWLAGAALAGAVAVILGLAQLGGDNDEARAPAPQVTPPAPGANATQQARNLARWLRANSR